MGQASAPLAAAEGTRMHAFIALRLATGIRTEKARALRWEHVDFGIQTRNRPSRQAQRCGAPCGPMGHEDREIAPAPCCTSSTTRTGWTTRRPTNWCSRRGVALLMRHSGAVLPLSPRTGSSPRSGITQPQGRDPRDYLIMTDSACRAAT
jgi:hypothetical protein